VSPRRATVQVVDASAIVAALLDDGPDGRWVEDRLVEADLVAPHLMPFEVADIVRRTAARGAIDATAGAQAVRDLADLAVDLVAFDRVADRVWELRRNLTAYDASYVATAERLGTRLVTLDARLASASGIGCEVLVAPREAP
jgi:predicted nucleic acid-binding protein